MNLYPAANKEQELFYADPDTWDDPIMAECNRCKKLEKPEIEEKGAISGIYYCNNCEKELTVIKYFSNLQNKNLLKENADWISRLYPPLRKYAYKNYQQHKKEINNFDIYIKEEKINVVQITNQIKKNLILKKQD